MAASVCIHNDMEWWCMQTIVHCNYGVAWKIESGSLRADMQHALGTEKQRRCCTCVRTQA
eukprot:1160017-Pelagomonas_calceolata.AAC.8